MGISNYFIQILPISALVGQTRHDPHGVGPQRLRQLPRHAGDAGGAAAPAGNGAAQRSGAVSEVRARSVG